MYMAVVAMVTDLTILTEIIVLVHHIMVDRNHHLIDKETILTDINLTVRGVLAATDPSTATEVLEDVRV